MCHYSCRTCQVDGQEKCDTCDDENITYNRKSELVTTTYKCICIDGYYDDLSQKECQSNKKINNLFPIGCHYSCSTC